jgi:hypothetical protein
MNSNQKETRNHTIQYLDQTIKHLNHKYTPGPISVYLINSVIIPALAYRLQLTPVTKTYINQINTRLRRPRTQDRYILFNLCGQTNLSSPTQHPVTKHTFPAMVSRYYK